MLPVIIQEKIIMDAVILKRNISGWNQILPEILKYPAKIKYECVLEELIYGDMPPLINMELDDPTFDMENDELFDLLVQEVGMQTIMFAITDGFSL